MEELYEIAGIIAKYRLKKVEIINNSGFKNGKAAKKNKYTLAYHLLIEGKLINDEEAARLLGFKNAGTAYHSFKHRFQEKLLNGLFHIEVTLSDYFHAEYLCSRLRHVVYMLFLYGSRNAAMLFTGKMLSIAEDYDLAVYKMFCYKRLRDHYSYTGDGFRYKKINMLHDQALDQMILEDKAENFLSKITVQYARTIVLKPEVASEAFGYADEIAGYLKKYDSHVLQYYKHKVRGLAYQIAEEYEMSNQVWEDWKKYLQDHPLYAGDRRFGEVAVYQMDNYTYLSQYDEAKKCATACLKFFREDSPNRLIFLENYFLLALRSGDYINSREIFHLATKNQRLKTMPVTNREKWKIFEAYLYYVEEWKNGYVFDLEEFSKDIRVYKKDKAGFNISLLIVQICILIRTQPNDRTLDKVDALRLYKRRYLKSDVSYRVNIFMDLLFAIDKADYSYSAIKDKEALLLKKLEGKPMANVVNIEGLEVISFEKLWNMVLNDLKRSTI